MMQRSDDQIANKLHTADRVVREQDGGVNRHRRVENEELERVQREHRWDRLLRVGPDARPPRVVAL